LFFGKKGLMNKSRILNLLLFFLLGAFVVVLLRNAWVGDDAYITFKTIANFVYGYGLRYNVVERVQTYTHPLWLFLLSASYYFTREPYYTTLFVSMTLSTIAVGLVAFKLAKDKGLAILAVMLLMFSKAFMDYSTSGLENPLTHFILAIYLLIFFKVQLSEKKLLQLSFIAALGTLNRMDTLLLYLPVLIYTMWQIRKPKVFYLVLLGFIPFIFWECFSLFYYGFPFPNTAYAKLNVGIPRLELIRQGLFYLWDSLKKDPLTLAMIVIAGIVSFFKENRSFRPVVAGIILYVVYVIYIGGDFMSGRFLAAPFFLAVILIARLRLSLLGMILFLLFSIILGLSFPLSPVLSGANYGSHSDYLSIMENKGVVDERGWYNHVLGYLNAQKSWKLAATNKWKEIAAGKEKLTPGLFLATSIGYSGYYLGPGPWVEDFIGLVSPFLVRLPYLPITNWRIGHFERHFPAGYYETLLLQKNKIKNKNLALYYDKLALVTRGKLISLARMKEILRFNLGQNNYLLEQPYLANAWWQDGNKGQLFSVISLMPIDFGCLSHAKTMQVTLADNYSYVIFYLRDNNFIATQNVKSGVDYQRGTTSSLVEVPPFVWQKGYDSITIVVIKSYRDSVSFLGRVKLID